MNIKDLPSFRKKMDDIDRKRTMRLKELKDTRDMKGMVTRWAEEKLKPKILSDKQRMAIHFLTDFVRNYSYAWIATRLNISEQTLTNWRNQPLFLRELDKEITRRRSFIRVHAFRNVHRAIMRGDMKATWNYLKMSGDLKENVEVIDRTGEVELNDSQLAEEINKLQSQLAHGPDPSSN